MYLFVSCVFFRLYGSYNVIHNEQMGDVYLALTGGVAERVDLKKQAFDPLVLYYHITLAVKNGEFVSCFVSVCAVDIKLYIYI